MCGGILSRHIEHKCAGRLIDLVVAVIGVLLSVLLGLGLYILQVGTRGRYTLAADARKLTAVDALQHAHVVLGIEGEQTVVVGLFAVVAV